VLFINASLFLHESALREQVDKLTQPFHSFIRYPFRFAGHMRKMFIATDVGTIPKAVAHFWNASVAKPTIKGISK
jgi:hypothetical protein